MRTINTFTLPAGRYILGDAGYWIRNPKVWEYMIDDMSKIRFGGMVNVPKVEPQMEDDKYMDIEDLDECEATYDKDYEEWEANPVQGQIFRFNTGADGVYELYNTSGEVVANLISDAANISLIPVELADTTHDDRDDLGITLNVTVPLEVEIVEVKDDDSTTFLRMIINNQFGIDF